MLDQIYYYKVDLSRSILIANWTQEERISYSRLQAFFLISWQLWMRWFENKLDAANVPATRLKATQHGAEFERSEDAIVQGEIGKCAYGLLMRDARCEEERTQEKTQAIPAKKKRENTG
ncbi:hypothetical protein ACP70R_030196 [Stipagrostis hirtigluma subsp. patula]